MNKVAITRIQGALLVLIIFAAFASGSVYWFLTSAEEPDWIWGEVILDSPVVGATISIFDFNGKMLYEEENATYKTGAFVIDVSSITNQTKEKLPDRFRIVAKYGTLNNESFIGSVSRQVRGHNDEEYYEINAITTLMDSYYLRNPEVPYDQAKKTVECFLAFPAGINFTYAVDTAEWDLSVFDHSKFMDETDAAGGFDHFISQLTNEMEAGGQHPIKTIVFGLGWGDALKGIGKGIGNGMAGWIGGQAIGWVFHAFGYRTTTEHILENMSKQLDTIQNSVEQIKSLQEETIRKINALAKALQDMSSEIKWQNQIGEYKNRRAQINTAIIPSIAVIQASFEKLQAFSKLDPLKTPEEFVRDQINKTAQDILSTTTGIENCLNTINMFVGDSLGEMGLLNVWSTLITLGATSTDLNSLYSSFENRFAYILMTELTGISLVIDANRGMFGNNTEVQKYLQNFWNKWKGTVIQQVEMFLEYAERLVATRIDTATGTEFNMYAYSPPVNVNLQTSGSFILQKADEFAEELRASLEGGDETSKGLIKVRIINYPEVTEEMTSSNIGLKLQEVESNKTYPNELIKNITGTTIHDRSFKSVPFKLSCYKFIVPFGTYRLGSLTEDFPKLLGMLDYNAIFTVNNSSKYSSREVVAFSELIEPMAYYSQWSYPAGNSYKGLARDNFGNVYTINGPKILKYDSNHRLVKEWDCFGAISIASDGREYVYVGNIVSRNILKYDSYGNPVKNWKGSSKTLYFPWGITDDESGNIYVTDLFRVLKFDYNGNLIWETHGSEGSEISNARGVGVDAVGNVYVVVDDTRCVLKFDPNGKFVTKWGVEINGEWKNSSPANGMVLDTKRGYIYLTDGGYFESYPASIQKYDLTGELIKKVDLGKGAFPSGAVIDSVEGDLYIVDMDRKIFQVWSPIVFVSDNW